MGCKFGYYLIFNNRLFNFRFSSSLSTKYSFSTPFEVHNPGKKYIVDICSGTGFSLSDNII